MNLHDSLTLNSLFGSAPLPAVTTDYTVLANTSILWLKLDETTDVAAANETGTPDGVYNNLTPSTDSVAGIATPVTSTAIDFNGTNDHVSIAQSLTLTDWSQSIWVESDSTTADQYITSIGDGAVASIICGFQDGHYNIHGGAYPTGTASDTQIPMSTLGTKDHLVFTYDHSATELKAYKNGSLQWTVTVTSGDFTPSAQTVRLGSYDGTQDYFDGTLDEYLIFDSVLSQSDITLLATGTPGPTTPTGVYISTTGTAAGDGSYDDPYGFGELTGVSPTVALSPGDTVYFKAGTYDVGNFDLYQDGTAANPITFRSAINEWAIIDFVNSTGNGISTNNGDYNIWSDMEWTSTKALSRYSNDSGSGGAAGDRGSFYTRGFGNRLRNLIIHDCRQGAACYATDGSVDTEIYGCIIYNNGWKGNDGGHGHGIYCYEETNSASGTCTIKDNIIFANAALGIQRYSSSAGDYINGCVIEGNTCFYTGSMLSDDYGDHDQDILVGAAEPIENTSLIDNMTLDDGINPGGSRIQIGSGGTDNNVDITLTDNYFVSDLLWHEDFTGTSGISGSGNEIVNGIGPVTHDLTYTNLSAGNKTAVDGIFPATPPTTTPTVLKYFIRPNDYTTGKGNITVYNWADDASVTLLAADIATVLSNNDTYAIHNASDPRGTAVKTGTWTTGSNISLPMAATAFPTCDAWDANLEAARTMPKTFGAFILTTT